MAKDSWNTCLPQKTRWFCAWAIANCEFDYLFKCDDDTYVCLERLLASPRGAKYVGHDLGGYAGDPRKSEWPLPYHNLMHAGHPDPRHAAFLSAATR